jgi:hypothetical protein
MKDLSKVEHARKNTRKRLIKSSFRLYPGAFWRLFPEAMGGRTRDRLN